MSDTTAPEPEDIDVHEQLREAREAGANVIGARFARDGSISIIESTPPEPASKL